MRTVNLKLTENQFYRLRDLVIEATDRLDSLIGGKKYEERVSVLQALETRQLCRYFQTVKPKERTNGKKEKV